MVGDGRGRRGGSRGKRKSRSMHECVQSFWQGWNCNGSSGEEVWMSEPLHPGNPKKFEKNLSPDSLRSKNGVEIRWPESGSQSFKSGPYRRP